MLQIQAGWCTSGAVYFRQLSDAPQGAEMDSPSSACQQVKQAAEQRATK